ncbi:MAG: hypothetical protein KDC98_05035 [Planctomycetes bacterium]|nr:hypothetical protein [Planctomycetota bacterium]
MIRNIIAVVVGLIVGSIVNMTLVFLNVFVLYPMPEGTDMMDQEQMNAYIATLPQTAFLVTLAAHVGQALVGGWVAARLAPRNAMRPALIVGVLTLLGCILNMQNIELPTWMLIELPLCLAAAWFVGQLEQRRRAGRTAA